MTPDSSPRSPRLTFESRNEAETEQLARAFAKALRPGDVAALDGPLGAGKTRFVRAISEALNCEKAFVSSPTFGLVQHYDGELPIVHIDAYRLEDSEEFERMGGVELLDHEGVTLIEWADRIRSALPRERWVVAAEHVSPTARRYVISSTFRDAPRRINDLVRQLAGHPAAGESN